MKEIFEGYSNVRQEQEARCGPEIKTAYITGLIQQDSYKPVQESNLISEMVIIESVLEWKQLMLAWLPKLFSV